MFPPQWASQVCERYSSHDMAIRFADKALDTDVTAGGTRLESTHISALRTRGRCLAAQRRTSEARQAFESAIETATEVGQRMGAAEAAAELKLLVLDPAGSHAEGTAKLQDALRELLGGSGDGGARSPEDAAVVRAGLAAAAVLQRVPGIDGLLLAAAGQ